MLNLLKRAGLNLLIWAEETGDKLIGSSPPKNWYILTSRVEGGEKTELDLDGPYSKANANGILSDIGAHEGVSPTTGIVYEIVQRDL